MNYAVNYVRSLWNYHQKHLKCGNHPQINAVEVTNDCNLNCPFCERTLVKERGIGYMTHETFNNIVNPENADMLRHVRLFGHGEPLLHPDLPWFVEESKKYAKTVGFSTNGLLLTHDLSERLLKAGLTTICFSLHTKAAIPNIMEFLKTRDEMNANCYVNIATVDPIEPFIDLNQPTLRYVSLPLHDWGLHGKRDNVCFWPWYGISVFWDGVVDPCCAAEQDYKLGNVNETSLTEIWNSHEYQMFRRDMIRRENVCLTCSLGGKTFAEGYIRQESPSLWHFVKAVSKAMRQKT